MMPESTDGQIAPVAEMWATYRYRGYQVMVIQQWQDSFGRRMIRIETTQDGGAHAEGMLEEAFMQESTRDPQPG